MNTTPQAETPVEALTMLLARKSMLTPAEHSALTAAIEAMQRQGEPVAWIGADRIARLAEGWSSTVYGRAALEYAGKRNIPAELVPLYTAAGGTSR